VVLAAVGAEPMSLEHAPAVYRDDVAVVLGALGGFPTFRRGYFGDGCGALVLEHAGPRPRSDPRVVVSAMIQDFSALQHASEPLKRDKAFILLTRFVKACFHSPRAREARNGKGPLPWRLRCARLGAALLSAHARARREEAEVERGGASVASGSAARHALRAAASAARAAALAKRCFFSARRAQAAEESSDDDGGGAGSAGDDDDVDAEADALRAGAALSFLASRRCPHAARFAACRFLRDPTPDLRLPAALAEHWIGRRGATWLRAYGV
jgi:hypothetical protein